MTYYFRLTTFNHFGLSKSTTEIYFLVLLIHFGSYQILLETPSFEKCPLRGYSSRLTTFTLVLMVTSASASFLTRTQAHTCGKPVYRSANLKKWVYTFTVGGLGGRLDSVEIKPTQLSQAEARLWLWLSWAWQYLNDLTMYLFNTVDLCKKEIIKKRL